MERFLFFIYNTFDGAIERRESKLQQRVPLIGLTLIVIFILLLTASILLGLFFWVWRRRELPGAIPFLILAAATAEWSVAYALELALPGLAAKTLMSQLEYIGISLVPAAWCLFALTYSGKEEWSSWRRIGLLVILPMITIVVAFTNNLHGLLWSHTALNENGPFNVFMPVYGHWFWINFVYSYGLLLFGSVVLFQALRNNESVYQRQFLILLLSPILPWIANILWVMRLSPIPQLDLSPFAFATSIFIFGVGIYKFKLFDLLPVGRPAMLDDLSVVAFIVDNKDRIVEINRAGVMLSGWMGDPIGQLVYKVFDWWLSIGDEHIASIELQQDVSLTRDGHKRFYNLQITPNWNSRQRLTGRLVLLRDVTSDKLLEEAIALAQVKTEFLAKVSHELRTPLTSIMGVTEMLEEGVYGAVSLSQKEALHVLCESAQQMAQLVNDLLQQARLDQGFFNLNNTEFYVIDLVDRIRTNMRRLVEVKGLKLSIKIDESVPEKLYGDPIRLYQILSNLVENAVKFTDKGNITLRIYRPNPKEWAILVEDTGIGIPEDMKGIVFNAFQQVHRADTRENIGFGLGLSIVKQLVTLMGGQVSLESEVGLGSKFLVTLPFEPLEEIRA